MLTSNESPLKTTVVFEWKETGSPFGVCEMKVKIGQHEVEIAARIFKDPTRGFYIAYVPGFKSAPFFPTVEKAQQAAQEAWIKLLSH